MTPSEQSAADAAWRAIHKGIDPRMFPSITFTGKSMYAAGLAHAREQVAAQLDARALQLDGMSYACSFAALCRSGISDDELSPDDLLIVQAARADRWRILPHRQYVKLIYKGDGLQAYRARPDMDALCHRLELFDA